MDKKVEVAHKSMFEITFTDGTSKMLSEEQANQLYDSLGHHLSPQPAKSPSEESAEKTETLIGQAQERRKKITRIMPEVPY